MPGIRDYPQAVTVNLTDALIIDQIGIGTRWCTVAQLLALVGGGPYDIAMNFGSVPPAGQTFLAFAANRAFTLPEGLVGSVAAAVQPPTSAIVFTLLKNGAAFGSINFAANAGEGTFTAAAVETFAPGDLLEVAAPGATYGVANLAVTFAGAISA